MVFSQQVDTPANTSESNPLITAIKLFTGIIYHIDVYFPPGPSGLLGVQLQVGGHQVFPYNRGAWVIGDDVLFAYDDLMSFDISTEQLDIYTYNSDTVYSHKCLVNIGIVTEQQFINAKVPNASLNQVVTALDNLTAVITKQLPSGKKPSLSILGQTR